MCSLLKRGWAAALGLSLLAGATAAVGADEPRIEALALCRDSWLDWKNAEPAKLDSFIVYFRSGFKPKGDEGGFEPTSAMTIGGLKVRQVFPQSVGMGLGFSALVDAPFDVARQAVERALGKPLGHCEAGDGMRACELPIADRRTVTLASGDTPGDKTTLIGCFYFYEK